MEVRQGYKQTEVGIIPDDWDVTTLGNLCWFIADGTHYTPKYVDSGVPFYSVENVTANNFTNTKYITRNEHAKLIKRCKPEIGDILLTRIGTLGETKLIDWKVDASIYVSLALLKPNSTILGYYLFNYSKSIQFVSDIKKRSLINAVPQKINMGDIAGVPIPVPHDEAEQRAIAAALSDVDALIAALDALIAKKRLIKQGAMQELLTGKRRLPGFGGEWEGKRLGDLSEMGSGGTPLSSKKDFYGGDIPWVSISDMTKGGKFISTTDKNLSVAGFNNSAAQMFPAGTVLYAMYASLGECSIASVPLCSSQAILGITVKHSLQNEFLYYFLTFIKPHVMTMGQHGTQANLNKGMVQGFPLQLPSILEQAAISTILRDMDAEIAALDEKLTKVRQIKQGMMQELLTGRIRLV